MQLIATQLAEDHRDLSTAASLASCCAGAKTVYRRLAASRAAQAVYNRSRQRQLEIELAALTECHALLITEVPRIDLPVKVVEEMSAVPACQICPTCQRELDLVSCRRAAILLALPACQCSSARHTCLRLADVALPIRCAGNI